jgi:sec-independent protein translocase protein TatC
VLPVDATTPPEPELERSRMTFGEHLTELRSRLVKALLGTLVAVGIATAYADELVRVVLAPFQEVMRSINANPALVATGPTQPVITYFKVSLIAGLIVGAPIWIYQIWAFIAAGLYTKERRWVFRFAPLSFVLFCGGVLFGYFVLLPVALKFMLTFASTDLIQNWITINEYFSLFTMLTLALGIAFQLPVVMLGLAKAGIISAEGFRKKRKITILLIFIVAGVLTPPDPITQPLVAVPLWLLYELGIVLAWVAEGGKRGKVQWSRWRRRGLIAVGLVVLIVIFRNRIADVWGGVDVNQRVEAASSANLGWAQIGASVLGAPVLAAMRVNDDAAAPMLAIAGGGRLAVLRFTRSAEPAVVVEAAESRTWKSIVVQTGATVWHVELPKDLRMKDVLGAAVRGVRVGNDESRRIAREILEAAMGTKLAADDEDAAFAAAEAWLEPRRDEVFVQPQ